MRSLKVAQVWGIPIKIHISLLVVLPLFAWLLGSGQQVELYAGLIEGLTGTPLDTEALTLDGALPWIIGSAAAVGLFVSVALHELGHAWAALRYDFEVESITLWILGGLASLGSIPREWDKEFWIAVAGPITSILTGVVCYAALFAVLSSQPVVVFVVGWLAVTNVVLAVFNMVPAFPMDGGRVLRALLARNQSYAAATRTAAGIGKLFAILFAAADLLERLTVADLMATDLPTFDGAMPAFDALVALDQARASEAFVATPEGTRVVSRADFASAMEMRKVLGRGEPL
jgi:Zn-dependent protease